MKKYLVLAIFAFVTGCATVPYQPYAREVKKKPAEGGLIALNPEYRPEDRQKADALMAANCGPNALVKVSEEGEQVVGEKTKTSGNKYNEEGRKSEGFKLGGINFGSTSTRPEERTSTESEKVAIKEWQIAYNCVAIKAPEAAETHKKKSLSRK